MTRDVYNQSGLSGASYVGTGQAFAGEGGPIHVLVNTVIASATAPGGVAVASLAGPTIVAGSIIPGKFTAVALTSGLIAIPNLKSGNTVA